jgi:hypothetical protein
LQNLQNFIPAYCLSVLEDTIFKKIFNCSPNLAMKNQIFDNEDDFSLLDSLNAVVTSQY